MEKFALLACNYSKIFDGDKTKVWITFLNSLAATDNYNDKSHNSLDLDFWTIPLIIC